MTQIQPVLLAAGQSRRFGENKLLKRFTLNGVEAILLEHSIRPWLAVFDRLLIVVPGQSSVLANHLQQAGQDYDKRLVLLPSQHASQGMGHSLADAINASAEADGWLIGLADMPLLPVSAIQGVNDLLMAGAPLAAAFFEGKQGHPVGFSAEFFGQLSTLEADRGARAILLQQQSRLHQLQVDDMGILLDIDTPEALLQLQQGLTSA